MFARPRALFLSLTTHRVRTTSLIAAALLATALPARAGVIVVNTTDSATLSAALNPSGLMLNSAMTTNGTTAQFGTFSNFPTFPGGSGVVLSTGQVSQVTPAFHDAGSSPSTATGASGTPEFTAYGPGNIANFNSGNDVARLAVTFTLAAPSKVSFDFIFGSVEYPVYTSSYTDAFLAFLDGTTNQISFDANNKPVQVGASFAALLTTSDLNTAFYNPHGLISSLTTTTPMLGAGLHMILFEMGDVNDGILDSAVFIGNMRTSNNPTGTDPTGGATVPEPASLTLFGLIGVGAAGWYRRRARPTAA